MKMKSLVAGLLGVAVAGISTANADDWQNRSVFTAKGIVKFVPDSISPEDLGNLLFPVAKKKPLTRSIFEDNEQSEGVSVGVSVAMLINFEYNSSELTPDSKVRLDTLGNMLNLDSAIDKSLTIEGHTDIVGSDAYNMALSMRRAESVKRYLVFQHDIGTDRLAIDGRGESELIDPENPKGSMNRRVQFAAG